MIVYYRVSNNGYNKSKLDYATKVYCLNNALKQFYNNTNTFNIVADNVTDKDLISDLKDLEIQGINVEYTSLNNGASFRYILDKALLLDDDEYVYFLEDDYIHLDGSDKIIKEGLERSDYVSLYDHPDKYIDGNRGGNPFVEGGGEITRVILTGLSHWKLTNSTTMTFACKVSTLKDDSELWRECVSESYPKDFATFMKLREKNKTLITPIPSMSTHCENNWLAPLRNWRND